jgi:hypothetical protein
MITTTGVLVGHWMITLAELVSLHSWFPVEFVLVNLKFSVQCCGNHCLFFVFVCFFYCFSLFYLSFLVTLVSLISSNFFN